MAFLNMAAVPLSSFLDSLNKRSLSTYYVSGAVLGTGHKPPSHYALQGTTQPNLRFTGETQSVQYL